ncbi:hypothetical protein CCUS01_01571 [Colletotrichum cuscutae]|uniref:Uncharacterized protein n=1 Tax=Colletotrichum cuscutae TaxID=1209917 RepID=A0AAI9UNY4_9PEZI|nr:hypothetical protein CCUS01_01571 [Colletotrichum cuscutae]
MFQAALISLFQSTFCSKRSHWGDTEYRARQLNMSSHEGGIPAILINTGRTMPWNGPSPATSTVWLRPNLEPRQRQRQPWTCRRPSPVTSLPIPSQPTRCCLQMLSPYSVTVVVSDRAGTTFGSSTPPYHHCLSPVSQVLTLH